MDWSMERYVRLYTRDTAAWLALSFDAQALFALLLRKVDRGGVLQLGKIGARAIAVVLNQTTLWESRLKPALKELTDDGCVLIKGEKLVIRNFVNAQESIMSAKARTALWRERRLVGGDETSPNRDVVRRGVTRGDSSRTSLARSKTRGGDLEATQTAPANPPPPLAGTNNGQSEETPEDIEGGWPSATLKKLRAVATGPGAAATWMRFLCKAAEYPEHVRVAAARKYLEHDRPKGKNLDYLVGTMRGIAAEDATAGDVETETEEQYQKQRQLERERDRKRAAEDAARPRLTLEQVKAAKERGRQEFLREREAVAKNGAANGHQHAARKA